MASWRAPVPRKASTFRACDAKEESSPKPKSKSKSKSKSAKNHASFNTTIATLSCFPKSANLDVMLGKMNMWCYLRGTRNQMLFKPDLCLNLREDLFNRLNFLLEFPPSPFEDDSALPTFKAFCDDTTISEEYVKRTIGKYLAWFMDKWLDHDECVWEEKSFRTVLVNVLLRIEEGLVVKQKEEEYNQREF